MNKTFKGAYWRKITLCENGKEIQAFVLTRDDDPYVFALRDALFLGACFAVIALAVFHLIADVIA